MCNKQRIAPITLRIMGIGSPTVALKPPWSWMSANLFPNVYRVQSPCFSCLNLLHAKQHFDNHVEELVKKARNN